VKFGEKRLFQLLPPFHHQSLVLPIDLHTKGWGEREERSEGKALYTSSCINVENLTNKG